MYERAILHLDMDAFFASVEQKDNPELKGKAVAVGGGGDRGVVAAASYEARKFGVHSAMATAYAIKLCPKLKVVPGRMSHYKSVSKQIRAIFERYIDLIEPLSLDEAFLDVSDSTLHQGSATRIAEDIRQAIKTELGLTASAGIAPNKFLAKICSDENKPDGQCVVKPEQVDAFVKKLSLKKIPGVGKVTVKRLARYNLVTCADVRKFGKAALIREFGGLGQLLYIRSQGIDDRELTTHWVRKSMSVEHTYANDIEDIAKALLSLNELYDELVKRLKSYESRPIKNQQIKLKFSDFKSTTVERHSIKLTKELFKELLPIAWERGRGKSVRLIGIGVSFKELDISENQQQLLLF